MIRSLESSGWGHLSEFERPHVHGLGTVWTRNRQGFAFAFTFQVSGFRVQGSGFGLQGSGSVKQYELFASIGRQIRRKGNSNSHGARPEHQIISKIKWTRASRLSTKNSLSLCLSPGRARGPTCALSSQAAARAWCSLSGFRLQCPGFRIQGSVFSFQGPGFRVQGSGFRVEGSG